jgi:hypothetical protein
MNDILQLATGTIPGRRHVGSGNLLVGKNNQDALGTAVSDDSFVAVVCDGCSSGAFSEFGARFAAATLPQMVIAEARKMDMEPEALTGVAFWDTMKAEILESLDPLARLMSVKSTHTSVVLDYFLFTIVGMLVTSSTTVIFSIGDGVFAINGKFHILGPHSENAPPYLGYDLLQEGRAPGFLIHECPTPLVRSALIATDGLAELLAKEPGAVDEVLGENLPPSLTPWLRKLNSEVVTLAEDDGRVHLTRRYGLLNDDTTIVAIRRNG